MSIITKCARKGHQWKSGPPPICKRCGLRLKITGKHWQFKHNESPWIKP